ncbi:hypothetical protein SAMN05446037_1006123 [Anaerovirgula multivorans]|uniref:Uncharacterized protein n=1 Tax=Anaerovirgula multivorans TaxID=312168 RepID=A0A239CS27_9FIRM|nr:hypothetical protein [Anaerovirgula multivorans]SNS22930.1 hypothetical protein SAMN05446037_1006123 [Anaerovirgula multivorans]
MDDIKLCKSALNDWFEYYISGKKLADWCTHNGKSEEELSTVSKQMSARFRYGTTDAEIIPIITKAKRYWYDEYLKFNGKVVDAVECAEGDYSTVRGRFGSVTTELSRWKDFKASGESLESYVSSSAPTQSTGHFKLLSAVYDGYEPSNNNDIEFTFSQEVYIPSTKEGFTSSNETTDTTKIDKLTDKTPEVDKVQRSRTVSFKINGKAIEIPENMFERAMACI